IGSPDAERLHKAAKASPRGVGYTYKDPNALLRQLSGERLHRPADIEIHAVDRTPVDALGGRFDRRTTPEPAVTERHPHGAIGRRTLDGVVTLHNLASADR